MEQGLRQGCVLSPLFLTPFFAALLTTVLQKFSEGTVILTDLMNLKKVPKSMGPEPAMDYVRDAVLRIIYADDACIVSPSLQRLVKRQQTKIQIESFIYLGGAVTETPDISVEIASRTRACWMRTRGHPT